MQRILSRLILILFAFIHTSVLSEGVLVGTAVRVVDGDTIDVVLESGLIRVRLHGIDAPEKSQPHGQSATAELKRLVQNKPVQLQPMSQDRFNRMIAVIYSDGLNVNEYLVREGHAWAFRRYLQRDEQLFCAYENEAREQRRGLWIFQDAIAPWEFRRRSRLASFKDFSKETSEQCTAALGKSR